MLTRTFEDELCQCHMQTVCIVLPAQHAHVLYVGGLPAPPLLGIVSMREYAREYTSTFTVACSITASFQYLLKSV